MITNDYYRNMVSAFKYSSSTRDDKEYYLKHMYKNNPLLFIAYTNAYYEDRFLQVIDDLTKFKYGIGDLSGINQIKAIEKAISENGIKVIGIIDKIEREKSGRNK